MKANVSQSSSARGMEKKQSLRSMTTSGHSLDIADNTGPHCCTALKGTNWAQQAKGTRAFLDDKDQSVPLTEGGNYMSKWKLL